ncbi:hypothetical protein [Pseudomonas sp. DSP3-2-2]|uniref:hypothetical protein n=1 Tax=unclassified Pseudomonas TaxID=196821 RepID=UPI003CF0C400
MQNTINSATLTLDSCIGKSVSGTAVNSTKISDIDRSFADTLKSMTTEAPQTSPMRNTKVTDLYEWLVEGGAQDPEWANESAFLYGCEYIDTPMLYVGDWPIIRIAATGEIFTPEKQAYFKQIADLYHEGRVKLYENEFAKGTPPSEILKKIFEYNNTLPDEFRKMSGWL